MGIITRVLVHLLSTCRCRPLNYKVRECSKASGLAEQCDLCDAGSPVSELVLCGENRGYPDKLNNPEFARILRENRH